MVRCYKKPVFTVSKLRVSSHDRLSDFFASSWQHGDSPVPLLVVRVAVGAVAVAILCWALAEACNPYWLLFLTNWGLLLVSGMMVSGVVVSTAAVLKLLPADSTDLPWYVSMYWVLHNTGITLGFMISALYWVLLYNPEMSKLEGQRLFWLDVATHGLNSVLVLVELLASRTPLVFLHVYQPLAVGLWYALFTLIYYLCGGTDMNGLPFIYEILDWRYKTRSSVIVALSTAALLIIWCIMYAIVYCRDQLSYILFRPQRTATVSPADTALDLQRQINELIPDFGV